MSPVIAGAIAALFGLLAWGTGTLTRGGAVAAATVGTTILVGTGWAGGALLASFFVTGTAVGRLFPSQPSSLDYKDGRRNAWQVVANGGAAAVGGAVGTLRPDLGLWMVAAGLAAANADTWATEIGQAFGGGPRDLLSGRDVPIGLSGGVTLAGTLGGAAGAAVIAAVAGVASGSPGLSLTALGLGFAGMLLDSAIGSGAQVQFTCAVCGNRCDRSSHCGSPATYTRGWVWINNSTVNAIATAVAVLAGGLAWWLGHS